jgi:hypothetical protein
MKRMLMSSRFQGSLVGILVCLAIGLGWPEENSEALQVTLVAVVGTLTAVWSNGTAREDAAAKSSGQTGGSPSIQRSQLPEGFTRGTGKVLTLLVLSGLMLLPNVACSSWDPGGQTRKALGQRSQFLWDANNSFATDIDGAQTGEFEMYQGGGQPVFNEDGTVNWEETETSYYLHYRPKADAAAMALDRAYVQSTIQQERQLQAIERLTGLVTGIVGARMGVTVGPDGSYIPPAPEPAKPDVLDRILDRLDRLEGRLPAQKK